MIRQSSWATDVTANCHSVCVVFLHSRQALQDPIEITPMSSLRTRICLRARLGSDPSAPCSRVACAVHRNPRSRTEKAVFRNACQFALARPPAPRMAPPRLAAVLDAGLCAAGPVTVLVPAVARRADHNRSTTPCRALFNSWRQGVRRLIFGLEFTRHSQRPPAATPGQLCRRGPHE